MVSCKLDLRQTVMMLEAILRMGMTDEGPYNSRCTFKEAISTQSAPRTTCPNPSNVTEEHGAPMDAPGASYKPQKMNDDPGIHIAMDSTIDSKPQKMDSTE